MLFDEPDRTCPSCGGELERWEGQHETSEMVDVLEVSYRLVKAKRQKYVWPLRRLRRDGAWTVGNDRSGPACPPPPTLTTTCSEPATALQRGVRAPNCRGARMRACGRLERIDRGRGDTQETLRAVRQRIERLRLAVIPSQPRRAQSLHLAHAQPVSPKKCCPVANCIRCFFAQSGGCAPARMRTSSM